jgi:hypothetical protein
MKVRAFALGLALVAGAVQPGRAADTKVWPTDLINIAAAANGGRIISHSSMLNDDAKFSPNNLIDGQVYDLVRGSGSYGWVSNHYDPINLEYVTIGFKDNALKRIGKIVLTPTTNVVPERWTKDVEVSVSTQSAEGPYQPVAQITVRNAAERQEFTILPVNARFVQLKFRSNWGSDRAVALGEVELYESISTAEPMGQLIALLEGSINELKRYRQTQIEGGTLAEVLPESGNVGGRNTSLEGAMATLQLIADATGDTTAANRLALSSTNIAAAKNGGKIVDYSSVFIKDQEQGPDPAFKPENLIDGEVYNDKTNKGSRGWASQGFEPNREYVTIGFREDRTKLIGKIVINPASAQSSLRWARTVAVQVTDGSAKQGPYRTVATINLRSEAINQEFLIRPVEAKYVRFMFMANGPGDIVLPNARPEVNSDRAVSLGEIEIYAPTASGDKIDQLISQFNQVLVGLKLLYKEKPAGSTAAKPAVEEAAPRAATTAEVG